MTEAQIKEKLSRIYLELLATKAGFKMLQPLEDHGVDVLLRQMFSINIAGKQRYIDAGRLVGIQLKCTTESTVIISDEEIYYDLRVKNFNDLIWRKNNRILFQGIDVPLILILLILPEDTDKWAYLSKSKQKIIFKGQAFWFYPDEKAAISKNKSKVRIAISRKNQIDLDFFDKIFNLFFKKK